MKYEKMSATDAVKHFEKNGYRGILPILKHGGKKEYDRVRKIISDANKDRVSDSRARALLTKYGGDLYKVETIFEVAVCEIVFAKNKGEWVAVSEEELNSPD